MANLCKRSTQARKDIKRIGNIVNELYKATMHDPGLEGFDKETIKDVRNCLRRIDRVISQAKTGVC